MALTGKLEVADKNIEMFVTSINWGVVQNVNKGQTQGNPHHTEINFVAKNLYYAVDFFEWANDANKAHNATITFNNDDGKSGVMSTLKIEEAICSGFEFSMDNEDEKEAMLVVTLSPKKVKFIKGTQ